MKSARKIDLGCVVNCFGFGASHDANMLNGIAEAGCGTYYYIENAEKIPPSFADCLGGLFSVIGQNIILDIQAQAPVTISHLSTHFRTQVQGNLHTTFLSDIQSEERRDLICEVSVPAIHAPMEEGIGMIILKSTLKYFNILTGQQHVSSICTNLLRPPPDSPLLREMKINIDLDKQKNRLLVAESMMLAKGQAKDGPQGLKQARQTLEDAIQVIIDSPSGASDPFNQNLIKDIRSPLSMMRSEDEYRGFGSKQINALSNAHSHQRANLQSEVMYNTSSRESLKSKVRK